MTLKTPKTLTIQELVALIRVTGTPPGAGNLVTRSMMLTPEYAQILLDNNDHNRRINQSKVDSMCQMMRNGEWHANGSSISITDTYRLSDGQHRCLAVVLTGIAIPVVMVIGVADIRPVISSIDQGTSRTVADILQIVDHESVPNEVISATNMLCQIMDGVDIRFDDKPGKAQFASSYASSLEPWVEWATNLAKNSARVIGNNRGRAVSASALAVLSWHMVEQKADPELVQEFFQGVVNPLSMPTKAIREMTENRRSVLEALHRRTLQFPLARLGGGKSFRHLMTEYAAHIIAYNRYLDNHPVQYIRPLKQEFRLLSDLPRPHQGGKASSTKVVVGEAVLS